MSNELISDEKDLVVQRHQIDNAISQRNYEQLAMLLSIADPEIINSKDPWESTALDTAVNNGDKVSVELLLAHGAIPDYKQPKHFWPKSTFSQAISSGNSEIIRLLLNHGCDPDIKLENSSLLSMTFPLNIPPDYWSKTVELDKLSIFQLLMKCKGRKISNDKWNQKMLLLACRLGSEKIVEHLLDRGVSIESIDENGWSCIFYAVRYRHLLVIKSLLARGANINHKDFKGCNALLIAVLYKNDKIPIFSTGYELIELLINQGADINATDITGLTPINMAFKNFCESKFNNYDIIRLLLKQCKIDLNIPDINGTTVLHRAVTLGIPSIIRDVLYASDSFVNINAQDNLGQTPLQLFNNFTLMADCLELMIEFSADTKYLYELKYEWRENRRFLTILKNYSLKRYAANLKKDLNIDTILAQHSIYAVAFDAVLVKEQLKEIENMKKKILCDNLTYYDFLHAKKRTLIKVAKKPEMRTIFTNYKHKFFLYRYILCKNYLSGARSLGPIESKATNNVEENLNVIFSKKLPSLIVYNIQKYIDIEDMVTLDQMKLFD